MDDIRMLNAGEQGLVVEFGQTIEKARNLRIHRLAALINQFLHRDIMEVVPTYRSLLIYFNPLLISRQELKDRVMQLIVQMDSMPQQDEDGKVIYIPVCYDVEFGPDLDFVASHNRLSPQEVVAIHTSTPYLIYMLGFTPGYAYLGGMSDKIATPRLQQPRTKVPAGSVAIGGTQTAFYTVESPGGWQLIGRTPVKAFDLALSPPFLFKAGEYLHFQQVSRSEYEEIAASVQAGTYKPRTGTLRKEAEL